jgi:ATP-dependent Lhr-like helicase
MSDHQSVRERLRRAWMPFFSRYGRLLPIQLQAIPPVMDGQNVVICSPTASGKTEAIVAPIAERFLSERWSAMSVLYIIPTRALANDTLLRIEGPLNDMGISVALKHGDKPRFKADRLPDWLITTPESLDSLLCRYPLCMAQVRSVILDELHLLDGTYRGDQLRVLLRRLRQARKGASLATHALSATLSNPDQVARRYIDEFIVITGQSKREIECVFLESPDQVHALAKSRQWRKVVFFCNARQTVEETAHNISKQWAPYPVVVHHGSLDRRLREEAERVMKEAGVAVCVCTSTLEVGIDIGDIDLVVLVEMPYSASALLQRLGRGNRRSDVIYAAIIAQTEEARSMATAMLSVAQTGNLPPIDYQPDPSVAVQQIFSLLYQHPGGLPGESLLDTLSPLLDARSSYAILAHLQEKGWISHKRGYWYASEKVMNLGEKGKIHSNIPDSTLYTVVDTASGKTIGRIAGIFDRVFVLGHRAWEAVSVRRDTIYARPYHGKADPAIFVPHRNIGAFTHLLPRELRDKVDDWTQETHR